MTDIALNWDDAAFAGDLVMQGGDLMTDQGMRTAILISLFTDARADDGDPLPQAGAERRGWWGDGDIGSKLWLLKRAKITNETLLTAQQYCEEALQWLVDDGAVQSLSITAEAQADNRLAIAVILQRPDGPARQRFDYLWSASQ